MEYLDSAPSLGDCMAVNISDPILGPYHFSCPSADPTQGCAVNHFSVIKGFVVHRYYLIIIGIRWPLNC